jgi:hypothetical protein
MKYQNRGPIAYIPTLMMLFALVYILSFPRAGGPPNSLPKVDGAGD